MALQPETEWVRDLQPRLDEVGQRIATLEEELQRLRQLQQGLELVLASAHASNGTGDGTTGDATGVVEGRRLSAKECIIRVLRDAGRPLTWPEIQLRVSRFPNPPTASALTSAYYHNTRAGTRSFVPLKGGYAGLAGRDDEWQPPRDDVSANGGGSLAE